MTDRNSLVRTEEVKPPVILCVDDEPNVLSSLRRLFRASGYQVKTADSGSAGLELMDSESVDLVISDMRMPEMDGTQFLERVRVQWPETVRLLLTGYADITSVIGAINRGEIYRYITKPWDDNDIVLIVRQALERKSLEQERKRLEALALQQNEELKTLNATLESKVEKRTLELKVANDALHSANEKLRSSFITSIKVFSTLLEMRGGTLAGHSRRVAEMSRNISQKLGLGAKLTQDIFAAALLHEVGKVTFTDELLATPVAMMSPSQLESYRRHIARAEQLLLPLTELRSASEIVTSQFERYDGTGFPNQLSDENIPIGARVLSLSSDYDNMQIGTLTQRKLNAAEAKIIITHGSGKRYDPKVVSAFLELLEDGTREVIEKMKRAECVVHSSELKIGMVLSRDLITPSGMLMLSADHLLDQRVIDRIVKFENSDGLNLEFHIYLNGQP